MYDLVVILLVSIASIIVFCLFTNMNSNLGLLRLQVQWVDVRNRRIGALRLDTPGFVDPGLSTPDCHSGFVDSGIRRLRDSSTPGFVDSGIRRLRDSSTPGFVDSGIRRLRDSSTPDSSTPGFIYSLDMSTPSFVNSDMCQLWDLLNPGIH
ncbi:hypothetical protein BC826DRAFT_1114272 [Russula brevipes]|nr:hypothetical protein BC826DRAFT_1114272 [Russula brevipes]